MLCWMIPLKSINKRRSREEGKQGLAETASLWADVEMGYQWVHRAAHLLTNDEQQTAAQVRQNYETLLTEMEQAPVSSETVTTMLTIFRKVTASYWPGLFHCYDHADLPPIVSKFDVSLCGGYN